MRGQVDLEGAHIGGSLNLGGADLTSHHGPALFADNLEVSQDLALTGSDWYTLVALMRGGAL